MCKLEIENINISHYDPVVYASKYDLNKNRLSDETNEQTLKQVIEELEFGIDLKINQVQTYA